MAADADAGGSPRTASRRIARRRSLWGRVLAGMQDVGVRVKVIASEQPKRHEEDYHKGDRDQSRRGHRPLCFGGGRCSRLAPLCPPFMNLDSLDRGRMHDTPRPHVIVWPHRGRRGTRASVTEANLLAPPSVTSVRVYLALSDWTCQTGLGEDLVDGLISGSGMRRRRRFERSSLSLCRQVQIARDAVPRRTKAGRQWRSKKGIGGWHASIVRTRLDRAR